MKITAENTELILKKIKELPSMPLVVQKLIKVMNDDRSNADDVMQVLLADQALAGKILKLVNSSFYGLSGKVSTRSRAIVILGHSAIQNLATGLSVARLMAHSDQDNYNQRFWDHSITCAAACSVVAKKYNYPDPEEAFIAGLLHDLGHLVLKMALPEEYDAAMAMEPGDMLENEQATMGMSHTKAGQKLLKYWKLPGGLGNAVRFHHTAKVFTGKDDPLISLVALADALADALAGVHGEVFERCIGEEDFLNLIKIVGLDVAEIGSIMQEIDHTVLATRSFLEIPGDDAEEKSDAMEAPLKVTMLCSHPIKATWTREVLHHFGHRMVPMKEFFENVGTANDVDLVILDPGSLSSQQLKKIKPALVKTQARINIFAGDQGSSVFRSMGVQYPILPLAFSRSDLLP
jgi:HD-like signal output (HDOD) protein